MKPFTVHEGLVAPLDRSNVDTDQIIPKQFLKRIERSGYGQFLFYDWRFKENGEENPDFVLNQPDFRNATILLSRQNFGSGSSREHAPWALADYGFRVIIASSFADIFYNNCFKNGILPVQLTEKEIDWLFQRAEKGGLILKVDLEKQVVLAEEGVQFSFTVNPVHKERMLKGLDEIGITESYEEQIASYETSRLMVFHYMNRD
ncbi:3-isopropylmalate dehydratase small subunit [Thermicanus aegyptius]|uniref:3-isopropylmalate dehydratase small subunit n=1 Tax=Thermicanus aegyptius TaxID=94009 RepID=UPI000416D774|nr:3-isopropylmalate dehydratase small subunit [Thermicanus aegyptius]